MPWRDDVIANLPPPSFEGEPASLRQDILDELADHLECATARELRRESDSDRARRNVLARFGNPHQIARQLWLDAMKEQLMNQRILLGSQLVIAAAIVVLCVVVISALRQNQRANEAMIARLETVSAAAGSQNSASYDWPRLSARLVEPDGVTGVPDAQVTLSGELYSEGNNQSIQRRTDGEGRVTLGPMRPGSYRLTMVVSDGTFTRRVVVPPGPEQPPIVVQRPALDHKTSDVTFRFDMPEDVADENWVISVALRKQPRAPVSDGDWSFGNLELALNKQGRVAIVPNDRSHRLTHTARQIEKYEWQDSIALDAAYQYELGTVMLLLPTNNRDDPGGYYLATDISDLAPSSVLLTGQPKETVHLQPGESSIANISRVFDRRVARQPNQAHPQPQTAGDADAEPVGGEKVDPDPPGGSDQ